MLMKSEVGEVWKEGECGSLTVEMLRTDRRVGFMGSMRLGRGRDGENVASLNSGAFWAKRCQLSGLRVVRDISSEVVLWWGYWWVVGILKQTTFETDQKLKFFCG
jgi:hypothetical protein